MKINLNNKKKDIINICIIVLLTIIVMCLFWNIKLQGYSMPIQHTVNYSGEFTTRLGAVREIVIQHTKMEEPVKIEMTICDSNHQVMWSQAYQEVLITGKNQTLDSFEKENPLELPEGSYYVEFLINGEENGNLNCRFIEYSGSYKEIYTILCVLLIVGEVVILSLFNNKKLPLEEVYFIVAIVLGLALNFVMPPLGVPDEESHFMEAYELSSVIMGVKQYDENGYLMIREDDYNSVFYLHNTASIAEWYDSFHIWNDNDRIVPAEHRSSVSTKAPYAYLPSAIGITLARMVGFSGHMLLVLGRICNLLAVVLLVSLAIRLTPYGKEFLFVLGLLPEVLYLFTSYSYDGMNIALCILIVSYFLYLYHEKDIIGLKDMVTMSALVILMLPIKIVYVCFAILIVMIPWKKVNVSKKLLIAVAIAITIILGVFAVLSWPSISLLLGDLAGGQVKITPESRITLGYALHNSMSVIVMYLRTILGYTGTYFINSFGEIVGNHRYDGLDCYTLPIGIIILLTLLIIISLEDTGKNEMGGVKRFIIGGGAILSFMAVLTSMLFGFTTVAANRIMGLQGRYFLPLFVIIPLIVKNNFFELRKSKREVLILGMGGINLFVIFSIFFHYVRNYFS